MHYKAPDNSVHFLDDDSFVHLLPAGSIAITPEEAEALKPMPPPPTVLQEIAALEAANPITHRNLRDLSMTVAQIAATITGTDMMVNPAVQQLTALEAQIAALRAQL
jgi:hypothetical protein